MNGQLVRLELKTFLVIVSSKAPHDVLRWSGAHVFLQVMDSVLRNLRHAKTWGLPDAALGRHHFANESLDGRSLSCTVSSNHCDTAALANCEAHVHDRWLVLGGVLDVNRVHAEDDLATALDTLKRTRCWEGEFHDLIAELEV